MVVFNVERDTFMLLPRLVIIKQFVYWNKMQRFPTVPLFMKLIKINGFVKEVAYKDINSKTEMTDLNV